MLPDLAGKHVLLLQGPVGPFFRRFADELARRGARITKVNFNGGDALFFRGPEVVRFRGAPEAWPAACAALLRERPIDAIFLFGDCRPIHRQAIAAARAAKVPVWVFEEGYLRPDWVTLELGGVNGNSPMPRDPEVYRRHASSPPPPEPVAIGSTFAISALWAALYAVGFTAGRLRYPRYQHHRDFNAIRQGLLWARGGLRKAWYAAREAGLLEELTASGAPPYFLVPLQVHNDAQFFHSPYDRMEELIDEVVAAFAAHAPPDALLVLKHHPADRAYCDHGRAIAAAGARAGCADRLRYVHDLHLPTLLKAARGVVTMNSTVGTSALHHGTPVKVLGTAIYDLPGLTFQGPLADFFVDPGAVDPELFSGFVRYLRATNQINGSFYRRVAALGTAAGLDEAAFAVATPAPIAPPTRRAEPAAS
jgi:capsule polysaccharide modification protein KpsS